MPLTYTTDLTAVRALVRRCERVAGLSEKRAIDLVIAVSEVAANTVQHARSGSRAPEPGATAGYGLWMVNQVCDKVDLHSDETGTTISMHMNLKG